MEEKAEVRRCTLLIQPALSRASEQPAACSLSADNLHSTFYSCPYLLFFNCGTLPCPCKSCPDPNN